MSRRRTLKRDLERAAPEDAAARERSWRVVQAAYAAYEPRRRRRPWAAFVAVGLALLAGAAGVAAASAPRSDVGRLVRDVLGVGEPGAERALVRVPGGGRLLVTAGSSAWIVSDDGARRRLGAYEGASWSPRGRFAIAWGGGALTAVDPQGEVRWTLPREVSHARWAPGDGVRVAYVSGRSLRVVWGDGTNDRRVAGARADVAPAWRPDAPHVLAYVDRRDRVAVVAADSGERAWVSEPIRGPVQLLWSADGERLLVVQPRLLTVYDARGRIAGGRDVPPRFVAEHAAWAPRGNRLAVVRTSRAASRSEVVVLDGADAQLRERLLPAGPGRFGAPAWSPDGRRLLLPWPDADQWLFLRPAGAPRVSAVANIAGQFAPGGERPAFPRTVSWCCPG